MEHGTVTDVDDRDSVIRFLLGAVADMQTTIRAVDTKVGILLAALTLPLRFAGDAVAHAHALHGFLRIGDLAGLLGGLAYAGAAVMALRTLVGVLSPAGAVPGVTRYNTFYAPKLYDLRPLDAFLDRGSHTPRMSLQQFVAAVPGSEHSVVEDLSAEIMALAYIRDIKLKRQTYTFVFSGAAIFFILIFAVA